MAYPLKKTDAVAAGLIAATLSGCEIVGQQPNIYFSCTGGENGALTRVAYVFADNRNGKVHTKAARMQEGSKGASRSLSHSGINYVSKEVARVDGTFDPEDKDSGVLAKSLAAAAASRFCEDGQATGFQVLESLEKLKQADRDRIQVKNTAVPSFVPDLGDPSI